MIFFTDETLTALINGKTELVDLSTPLGKQCLDLYNQHKHDEIYELIKQSKLVDNILVSESDDGMLVVDGVKMDKQLANKIREFKHQGVPFDYLQKLAERIESIPSFHVRNQLYGFLKHNGHPITKDGTFIAYKKVSSGYKDLHTRQFDNSIGRIVQMDRSEVDDNPNNTCSSGLHVASYSYAENFGSGRLVLCEVAPEDVVSVPIDYNNMKMRCCRYKVVGETKESIEAVRWEDKDAHTDGDDPEDIYEGDMIEYEGEVLTVNCVDYNECYETIVDLENDEGEIVIIGLNMTNRYFKFA